MQGIYGQISWLIGRTPMLRLSSLETYFGLGAALYAKLESFNPSGSVKDRAALFMIEDAHRRGLIGEGNAVIEATSGNTGISLAMLSAVYGYRALIVMPESMSEERRALIRSYGGELVLTNGAKGMKGAIERAVELLSEIKGAYSPGQFENTQNKNAHYQTTGKEIYTDMKGSVDILVCGVGTGGTLSGTGRFLKEKNPSVKLVAVEPVESAVLSGRPAASHGIQGIGVGFLPPLFEGEITDEVVAVSTEEAIEMCRILGLREGVFAGFSSGAALSAAVSIAKRSENTAKNIAVILPDGGERYLSVSKV